MSVAATYREHSYWRGYQKFFPVHLRCEGDRLPEESLWNWREHQVHLDRFPSPSALLKLLVIHGAGGYGRMFAACGLAAREGGAEVVALDLPGYGLTTARRPYTHEDWVECVADLVEAERRRDGRPVVLFGGSLGGMIAFAAACRGNVIGVIATCLLDPRVPAVRRAVSRFPWLASVGVRLLPWLAPILGAARIPIRWLAKMDAMSGQEELNELVRLDPIGGGNRVPLRFIASYLTWRPPLEPEDFKICPVLLVHPERDQWTPVDLSRAFFDRLGCPKRLIILGNASHFPVEEPGLTQLTEAITDFLAQRQREL